MGIIIRQGVKYSTVAYVGVIIGAFNTIWLSPKLLTLEQIGLMRLVQENGLFLAAFVQLGAYNIADKFFPIFKTEDKTNNGLLFFLLTYPLIGFSIFCIALFLFKDIWLGIYQEKSPDINIYFYYFIPLIFFMMYQSILEAYSRINLRIVVPGIFRDIVLKILTIGLIIAFFLQLISFYQLIVLLVFAYGIIVLLLLAYLRNLNVLHLKPNLAFLNRKLVKEMGVYGAFILLGGAGSLIVSKIDFLMLGALAGQRAVAIYTIAFFIGTIIEIPRRAIAQISTPILSQAWMHNDIHKIEEIYKKSAINQLIIGCFLFLGIWSNADAIFNLIPNGEIFRAGKYVILFIGLTRLFDMATGVNGEIILQSRYYRFNLVSVAILAVLIVATNYVFIPVYGINGAAFATALSVFLYNVIKFLFLWIKFRIQPFSQKTMVVLLIAAITFFAAGLIPVSPGDFYGTIANILLRSFIITLVFVSLTLAFRVSEETNHLLKTGYSKIRAALLKKVSK
jgi:O-antigen/teichoic acid export membrane protein